MKSCHSSSLAAGTSACLRSHSQIRQGHFRCKIQPSDIGPSLAVYRHHRSSPNCCNVRAEFCFPSCQYPKVLFTVLSSSPPCFTDYFFSFFCHFPTHHFHSHTSFCSQTCSHHTPIFHQSLAFPPGGGRFYLLVGEGCGRKFSICP